MRIESVSTEGSLDRDVRLLAAVVAVLAGSWAGVSGLWLFPGDTSRIVLCLIAGVGSALAWVFSDRSPRCAAATLLATSWIAVTGFVLSAESFPSPAMSGYAAMTAVGARLFGVAGAIALSALSLVAVGLAPIAASAFGFHGGHAYDAVDVLLINGVFLVATLIAFPRSKGRRTNRVPAWRDSVDAASDAEVIRLQRLNSLGQLSSGIAHDINNILTAVLGTCEHALRGNPPPTESQAFRDVFDAARRAGDLTKRLLGLARGSGPTLEVLDIGMLIQETSTLLGRLLPDKIRLGVDIQGSAPLARVARTDFERVVVNLVLNARDAMPHGGDIRIRVGGDAEHVSVSVSDSGDGIPPEVLDRIFENFYTTKEPGQGTGLGLAIVKSVVEAHRGNIEVDSVVGAGCTFTLKFPRFVGSSSDKSL